ncbi:polycystic kidney disease 1-like 3 [Pelobates cultripes]|uniref:Polycystic kidney disease 1-like 3 n=1 Tax=Pelobates cultripes TaxID=61616 RepID=A0AAD1TGF5_PELCU|nr:polycystic kidney disease 1-like 3 [Pelobates cultripes]
MRRVLDLVYCVIFLLSAQQGILTASSCLGPSVSYLGSCYQFVQQRTNYWGAQNSCLACEGQLANVSDGSVLAFLVEQLNQSSMWWVRLDTKESDNPITTCTVLQKSSYSFEVRETTCLQVTNFICQTEGKNCNMESNEMNPNTSTTQNMQSSVAFRRRRSAGESPFYPDLLAMADQLTNLPTIGGSNLSELLIEIDDAMQDKEERNITELAGTMSLLEELNQKIQDPKVRSTQQFSNLSDIVFFGINSVLQSALSSCSAVVMTAQERQSLVNSALDILDAMETSILSSLSPISTAVTVQTPMFSILLQSINSSNLGHMVLSFSNNMSGTVAKAVLPSQAALNPVIKGLPSVQIQMRTFAQSPFLSDSSFNVSGTIASLSFLSGIQELQLQNLSDYFQIILPRSSLDIKTPTKIKTIMDNGLLLSLKDIPLQSTLVIIVTVTHGVPLQLYQGRNIISESAKTQGSDQDSYTWILTPDLLPNTTSPHTFFVCSTNSSGTQSMQMTFSSFTAHCGFWDNNTEHWRSTGCKVGPQTTNEQIQCLCNHLSFFGSSFFVPPVQIDVTRTAEYFSQISENPVMVVLLACFYACYILVVIWARRMDLRDQSQSRVILPRDNDPCALYRYRITVCTGHRRNAATSSKVSLILCGSQSQCGPVLLTDGRSGMFKSSSVDIFLLSTPYPLGDLKAITLSHDGTGPRKSWYVIQVTAQDIQLKKSWHFLCNAWLSLPPKGDSLSKTFPAANEQELTSFRNIFLKKTIRGLRDEHIWISVLNHPARSVFTRVQRVSCCMCLLLCTIVINLMFWEMPQATYPVLISVGSFSMTWKDIMIGFESALLMFPVNILIIFIFRNTQPRESGAVCAKTKKGTQVPASKCIKMMQSHPRNLKSVIEDMEKIAQTLNQISWINLELEMKLEPALRIGMLLDLILHMLQKQPPLSVSMPLAQLPVDELQALFVAHFISRKLRKVSQDLKRLGLEEFQDKQQYDNCLTQLQSLIHVLDKSTPPLPSQRSSQKQPVAKKRRLPWWFLLIGWSLLLSISAVSTYFTMMYGFRYGKQSSIRWIISMALSLFQSIFILQPLKVVGFAVFFALVLKKVEEEEEEDEDFLDTEMSGTAPSRAASGISATASPPGGGRAPWSKMVNTMNKQLQNTVMRVLEIILQRNESSNSEESRANLTKTQNLSLKINITSEDQTLVATVQPDIKVPIILYLGYQEKPNSTYFMDNVSLPSDNSYTWVVSPDQMNGSGIYYITVNVTNQSIWDERDILFFSVDMFSTQCVYWNKLASEWSEKGCHVGGKSTVNQTQCLCNHLTFFGVTFFVMPHVVDLSDTLSLFANVSKNPVGLALLGALIGFYLVVVAWASRKDKEDIKKVRVAILTDNDAAHHIRYVIKVCTGHRKGAGTTSKVVVTLYGSEGQSEPHILSDPEKQVFTRGSVDVFLLKTRYLGELHSLRLWHSNSGTSPSWYVYRVSVIDLAAQKTWYFFCDCWLASDVADCQLDRIFPTASKGDIMSLRYLFFSGSVEKFLKDHLWLSVWTRCAWSPFTRVQRICCCMSLLFCSLVINIMFWNLQGDGNSQPGQFFITFTQIQISIQSAMMLVPVNLLIVQMFQLIQVQVKQVIIPQNKLRVTLPPKPPSKEAATEHLLKDLKEIVDFLQKYVVQVLGENPEKPVSSNTDPVLQEVETLSNLIQSYICVQEPQNTKLANVMTPHQCLFLHRLYKVLEQLKFDVSSVDLSYVAKPINYIQATNILYDLQDLLRSKNVTGSPLPSSVTTSFPVVTQQRTQCIKMPKAFTFLCWVLLFGISGFSAYYMVLLSLDMTKEKATSWLISMLLSFFQSLFVLPPLKVLGQTVFLFRVMRRSNIEDSSEEQQLYGILSLLDRPDWELSGFRDQSEPAYQAPANRNTTSLKTQKLMERRLYQLIHDIIVHILFLITTMMMAYADKSPNEYILYSAMQNSFSTAFNNIQNIQDFYSWSSVSLLPNLYSKYPGFITDGNCFLVGPPRIRQVRVLENSFGNEGLYNAEDTKSYGPGWTPRISNDSVDDWWKYHTGDELGESPLWAQLGTYSGGGYLASLGMNKSFASRVLTELKNKNWLDSLTKAVFVEFNVYNANVNLFCLANLILETNMIGKFWKSVDMQIMRLYQNTSGVWSMQFVSDIVFMIILLYIIIQQILRLKTQKWAYFYSSKNLLDLSIVAISCCNTGLYIKRMFLRRKAVELYHQDHEKFVSLYETATVDSAYTYGTAFLVALMTVKLWRLLSLNPNLHLIMITFRKAWNEIGGFLFTILILLVAYSISCNLLFGWSIYNYRTFFNSIVTIISLLVGIFNYDKVLDLDPVLGSMLIFTCVIFLVFVVLNIFFSALLDVFSKERQCPTHFEEKEIVDLLFVRLSGLFGLQKKPETSDEDSTEKDKKM